MLIEVNKISSKVCINVLCFSYDIYYSKIILLLQKLHKIMLTI